MRTFPNFLWVMMLLLIANVHLVAQTSIGGTINRYWPVTGISGATVYISPTGLGATHTLATNDRVLIIQMKGANINGTTGVTTTTLNQAGNYEFATVQSASGTTVTLSAALTNTYNTTQAVQLVWVPIYGDVDVTSTLTSNTWNGTSGGILAFVAKNVLLNAPISVGGKGFRGGYSFADDDGKNCDGFFDYFYNDYNEGGAKGEGISTALGALFTTGYNVFGRGSYATGGGGGNSHNAGGAGGANGGNGGSGGMDVEHPAANCVGENNGGITTIAINYSVISNNRVFLGGGGGAGHRDDGSGNTQGGNGGGIIFINANRIQNPISKPKTIDANGLQGTTSPVNVNGAGGGGAGGSIILHVCEYVGNVSVLANGANGPLNTEDDPNPQPGAIPPQSGPGGGGGGGVIRYTGSTPTYSIAVNGGTAGYTYDMFGTLLTRGAQNGNTGLLSTTSGYSIPIPGFDFNIGTTFCGVTSPITLNPAWGTLPLVALNNVFIEIWSPADGIYYVSDWVPYSGGGINLVSVAQTYGTPLVCGKAYKVKLAVHIGCTWLEKVKDFSIVCPPTYNTDFSNFPFCYTGGTTTVISVPSASYANTSNIWFLLQWNGTAWTLVGTQTTGPGVNAVFTGLTNNVLYNVSHTIQNNLLSYCNQAAFTTRPATCNAKTDAPELSEEELEGIINDAANNGAIHNIPSIGNILLQAYPNPTSGNISLDLIGIEPGNLTISVVDYSGKLLKEESLSSNVPFVKHNMDMAELSAGIYFVLVRQNGGVVAQTKIVKH